MAVTTTIPPLPPRAAPAPAAVGRDRTAQACDALLTFCVLAFAVWTLAYHACLLLGLGSAWALAVLAAGVVPCGLLAVRHEAGGGSVTIRPSAGRAPRSPALLAIGLALAAAASLAWAGQSWLGLAST